MVSNTRGGRFEPFDDNYFKSHVFTMCKSEWYQGTILAHMRLIDIGVKTPYTFF